ncbi:transposase [Crassaminicella thermophila]|uniref:Transposase n=1 Tax=Crassaminicella thermophila TaxID=2599308 RepID=A0A5C0SF58_CRATE|nr:helix-turn-helix domain-containing protein [Crassaminicella thermophila]QEK12790.1 transposase [Crassaminicella thermophila]
MGRKGKIDYELKIKAVEEYLNNVGSQTSIASKYGVTRNSFRQWIVNYQSMGKEALMNKSHNNFYSKEFKITVIKAYLEGDSSIYDIAKKFKIPSHTTVLKWIIKYNGHEELKSSGIGEDKVMANGRKTNFNERIEIVKHCIEHQNSYSKTADKYKVSYHQVYSWTKKYEESGVEALKDKRGKQKNANELSEIEKLRALNKLLEAQK